MTELILTQSYNNILHIQFNRADKMNAINLSMYDELNNAFEKARCDDNIHVVLISSANDHFTAGNDIADFLNISHDIKSSSIVKFIKTLARFEKPLIAGVRGNAIGIGTTLLLHCDLVYATPDARFSTPFAKLGLVPEAGASYLLPKIIGNAKAAKMLLLGESCTAIQAENSGLITEIYAEDNFDDYIIAKAEKLAKMPKRAILESKALIKNCNTSLDEQMNDEIEKFSYLLTQDEFKNIAKSFLNKTQ